MTAYDDILGLVAVRSGLLFVAPRIDSAAAGIRRSMARAGVSDIVRYRAMLAESADVLDDLLVELTVGETYFFRQPEQFAFIRREVLPEIRRRRGDAHVIRCWSAGCASGEEAYSLAIVLEQEGLLRDHARVYATDVSRAALAKARAATYGAWSLRGDGADAVRAYAHPRDDRHEVDDEIRRRVVIQYGNLALDHYPSLATGIGRMDLVLCRNVLIYFDRDTIHKVARHLFASLADGGWLITGPSDPLLGADAPFESIMTPAGVVYRRPILPNPVLVDAPYASVENLSRPLGGAAGAAAIARPTTAEHATPAPARPPAATASATPGEALAAARRALAAGNYQDAARLTGGLDDDPIASALHVRALASLDMSAAASAAATAAARHALDPELQYLRAALLIDRGDDEDAARALRRVLYLDRSLAAAHFALGAVLRRLGDVEGARRAYRNARDLCVATAPDAVLPLTDEELAGCLITAAESELAILVGADGCA
ncbi:MAG: chemotaxis protein CheR [Deltaproteobacteria bacterium]|nr:chemotaxis protein CheR [Deltaproteobacteria bacterium]